MNMDYATSTVHYTIENNHRGSKVVLDCILTAPSQVQLKKKSSLENMVYKTKWQIYVRTAGVNNMFLLLWGQKIKR